MAPITIYLGAAEILATIQTDLEAAAVADYVPVYEHLTRAIHAGETLSLKVTHPTVGNWLAALQTRYGSQRVHIERLTYRQRLRQVWGLEIPAQYTDNQIAQSRLIEVDITAPPGRSFEDFVLEVFFSPWLAQPQLPVGRLVDLLKSAAAQQWLEAAQRPLVGDIYRARLRRWQAETHLEGAKRIIEWLSRSPAELARQLTRYKALADYPDALGQRIFAGDFAALKALDLDLALLPVSAAQLGDALDHIRVHLETLLRQSDKRQALQDVLEQASGYLEVEFDAVQRLLHRADLTVDQELVRRVQGLFKPLQRHPNLEQALADLDLLIQKPQPSPPDPDPENPWEDEQWLAWAEEAYLPYRFWLEGVGQLTGDIAEYAQAYAEWLYGSYPKLRLSSPRMIYRALPALQEKLAGEAPVLILIIDNLNAKFVGDLTRYFQAEGFFGEKPKYYLAMLPSCTEVSKKCLVLAQPEPFPGTAYEKVIEETWQKALKGRKVRYLPHIGALRGIRQREQDVYFLNYLPIDIAFHQDEEQIGISHAQSARSFLRAAVRDVRAFAERIGAERDLVVVVVSDHGSTRIPADAPNIIDPKFFAGRVQDKHHRYVSISDHELSQLPDNVQHQSYIFERQRFGLETNYLAAKAYYRFLPTTANTYIHGGLSPEETLIPVAIFTPVTVAPKPLLVHLLANEFYPERKSEIQIEVTNTNAYACERLALQTCSTGLESTPAQVSQLAALSHERITLPARFRRSFGRAEKLTLRLDYTFLGQPQEQQVELDVKIKSIMQQSFDLKDLLGS